MDAYIKKVKWFVLYLEKLNKKKNSFAHSLLKCVALSDWNIYSERYIKDVEVYIRELVIHKAIRSGYF